MRGWVVNTLALCLFQRGELSEARIRSAQALERFRAEGDGLGLANALRVAGLLAEAEGEVVRARALLEEALAQARRVGHRVVLGFALTSLLGFALRRGEWDLALKLAEEGLRLAQQAQDPQGVAFWEDCLVKIRLREMPEVPSL
jgi:tetratricopeptide (TPR) repeat protein